MWKGFYKMTQQNHIDTLKKLVEAGELAFRPYRDTYPKEVFRNKDSGDKTLLVGNWFDPDYGTTFKNEKDAVFTGLCCNARPSIAYLLERVEALEGMIGDYMKWYDDNNALDSGEELLVYNFRQALYHTEKVKD